jgi:hypothetical protein
MPRISALDEFIDRYLTKDEPMTDPNQVKQGAEDSIPYRSHKPATDLNQVKKSVDDSIPYQGVRYDRSDVKFVHLPLVPYLKDRGLKLDEQMEAVIGNMPAGTFIAGGSVAALVNARPEPATYTGAMLTPSDIDLFFANQEACDAAIKLLAFAGKEVNGPDGVRMFTPREGSGGLPIQAIVIEWFPDGIDSVLDSFDFTVTHFGIDVLSKELVFNPVAPFDYGHRRLLNHRCEGDEASKKRLLKYIAKGFKPVGETLHRARYLGAPVMP